MPRWGGEKKKRSWETVDRKERKGSSCFLSENGRKTSCCNRIGERKAKRERRAWQAFSAVPTVVSIGRGTSTTPRARGKERKGERRTPGQSGVKRKKKGERFFCVYSRRRKKKPFPCNKGRRGKEKKEKRRINLRPSYLKQHYNRGISSPGIFEGKRRRRNL